MELKQLYLKYAEGDKEKDEHNKERNTQLELPKIKNKYGNNV